MAACFVRLSDRYINLDHIIGVELLEGGELRVATPFENFYVDEDDAETLMNHLHARSAPLPRDAPRAAVP